MSTAPWDSDAYDREVKAERARAQRQVVSPTPQNNAAKKDKVSDAEIKRREAADKAIRRLMERSNQ